MSLSVGPGRESSLEEAVAKLIRTAGVTFVASAGNHHLDACSYSPGGGALEAITVGALQTEGRDLIGAVDADSEALFSNFGPCVDLFAPGTAIDTAEARGDPYPGCQTDRSLKPQPRRGTLCAGTSMAAAHVAGCIALYLESAPPDMRTPDQVWKWLEGRAIQKGITSGEVYVERGDRRIFQPRFEFDEPTDISTRHPGTPNLSLYCGR
jgi:subtilisin family serine protease